jgi:hypothetical protein
MATTSKPRRRNGIEAMWVEDDLFLFDPAAYRAVTLNRSGAAVWELCDGTRTPDNIVEALLESFEGERHLIARDVRDTLQQLTDQGVVTDTGS